MAYDHNKYHKEYQGKYKDNINARRRELYKINKDTVLKKKADYRAKKILEDKTMKQQTNGIHIDLIEHEIDIDDYVKVTLSIPKKLTAMELKGIMIKANQLLKMSQINIAQGPSKHYAPRRASVEWNDSLVQELVNVVEARSANTSKTTVMRIFGEKHDITEKDVAKRYYYLMGHNLLPKSK